ncbi:MAG: DHH family phosphoesterase [Candidatus Nezhaarchaeales archaeon]
MSSNDASLKGLSHLNFMASQIAESINESSANLYAIVTHYDADGLAAASILARALMKIERSFIIRVVDQIDEETLETIPKSDYYIFVDLGSSNADMIVKKRFKPLSIIDHHEPLRSTTIADREFRELNPHNFGIDGGKEVSASGLAYVVAKEMNSADHLAAYLAISGAIGDRQESAQGFIGINKLIVQEAIDNGWIRKAMGLRLYGVPRQPLVKSLAYTMDPLLPGLTYDEVASQRFLEAVGIPVKKPDGSLTTYKDLSPDEVSKLATALIKHLLIKGYSPQTANSLFGYIYEFLQEPEETQLRYAHEFAQMLNACGRLRRHGIGLAIGLGDRGKVLSLAEALFSEYRRRLAQYISLIRSDSSYMRVLNNIQVLDLKDIVDERMLGSLSSIVISSYMCDVTKPLISLSRLTQGKIKVSARMHESLSKRGINLGLIIKLAAEHVGGSGGGHEVAAGGVIPQGTQEVFVKLVDSLVGKALKKGV